MSNSDKDILEQNVETLLETGGDPPRMDPAARTRIREGLVAAATKMTPRRSPRVAVVVGVVAAAAAALIVTHVVGKSDRAGRVPPSSESGMTKLADGTTWIAEGTSKVTVLGDRRVRVEGAALIDVVPGKGTFIVETTQGTIRVLGTRFFVAASAERTTTAVVRGLVQLATSAGDVTLHAGEQAVAEPGRPPTRGPAPRLSHLVSWAAEARRKAEHDVTPLHNGTLFARDPSVRPGGAFGEEQPLPMVKLGIDVVIEDQVARVALDQTFHNPSDRVLEGMYRFAIPPDAALQRLAMYVDGKLTESAVVERMRARRIYEELVYRRVDPALLEWSGTGRLDLRVYPLPAHEDKRLVLAYTQSLPKLYEDWTLAVPLPEIDLPVGELAVEMTLRGCANCEITSPSHPIEVTRTGNDANVTYRKTAVNIGDSFVLRVRDPRQATTVATTTTTNERFMLVRAPVVLPTTARTYRPRTWVVLDDVSASRSAIERRAQADMIDAFTRELDEEDKLAVIAFDVTVREKLAPTRVLDVDRRALRASLLDEGDVGATDVQAALTAATALLAGTPPGDAMIVYLGDGVITSGARQLDALRAQIVGKAQFIGVGVGDGPDTQTLEALAGATGGYVTTIDLADDVAWRTFDLVAALHTTRATGVTARFVDATGALVPATAYVRSPQIADGEQLELVAKLVGPGTPVAVELAGTVDGAAWTQRIPVAGDAHDAGYLPRLWAQQHVAARLLAKHEAVVVPPCVSSMKVCPSETDVREARDESIRKEVVDLGKRYFLLSRHTSLIVLENDAMYARYGVTKGARDTWAPYVLPATIPVVKATTAIAVTPANVAEDVELVRVAPPTFYDFATNLGGGAVDATGAFGQVGTIGHGGGTGQGFGRGGVGESGGAVRTRSSMAIDEVGAEAKLDTTDSTADKAAAGDDFDRSPGPSPTSGLQLFGVASSNARAESRISTGALMLDGAPVARGLYDGQSVLVPQRYTWPMDPAFEDLTLLVPALFSDAADTWRGQLARVGGETAHAIEPAAAKLLAAARAALPTGTYRWNDREIAVDAQRRFGWRVTTESGLLETASFDGVTLTRRYAELGLDVTRPSGADDVALSLAYLPLLVADPAHYARWFEVRVGAGDREVTLATVDQGKATVAYVLAFDAANHLVAVRAADGTELVSITWAGNAPTAARADGRDVTVSFRGQAIADAMVWAHGSTAPQDVVVEQPWHLPAYCAAAVAKEPVGSAAWRRAQRQLLVAFAATSNVAGAATAFAQLQQAGGVALGDLVLASGGMATYGTTKALGAAIAPLATQPIARYLLAARAWNATSKRAASLAPEITTGAIGALWQLREISGLVYGGTTRTKQVVDKILAMPATAPALRLVAASFTTNRYGFTAEQLVRVWDSVATGEMKNVARATAATALANRGNYDEAADQLAKMVDQYDLAAIPPQVQTSISAVQQSRRGLAGWALLWAQWRDKVLAGTSYEHVMAIATVGAQSPTDLPVIFARAVALAGPDVDRQIAVARLAMSMGKAPYAQQLVDKLVTTHPTRALHQLAAQVALQQQRTADALAHLEAAQATGGSEAVSIATVRAELATIIAVAGQLALQSSGTVRTDAARRAMAWGAKWRAVDAGNPQIDRTLGDLQLAIGNPEEAWRQLSSVIERDPMSGAGYQMVAETFEQQGKVAEALAYWQQAIVIAQTDPTPRLRKAQALIALGRTAEGDRLLGQVANGKWHPMWASVVWQANSLLQRGKQPAQMR